MKKELINFENDVVELFNDGQLKSPVHLSGSVDEKLEDFLIKTFEKIKSQDWIFSTYRSHYHALLKGMTKEKLLDWVKDNKSIHVMDKENKIFTSAIVGGCLPIALGAAMAIKMKLDKYKNMNVKNITEGKIGELKTESLSEHVLIFCGDMTANTGIFRECFQYAINHKLPIKFIVECNYLSTDTDTAEVWGKSREKLINDFIVLKLRYPEYFDYIVYERKYHHY